VLAQDWMPRARQLADQLVAAGKLRSAVWWDAVCAVPRHEFVPDVFRQELAYDATWRRLDTATEQGRQQWLDRVYSNTALITALAETPVLTTSRSSSSMPGLMTRMLEALDVRDGHRVLEIGTGTGYNAGLLSHRLGDTNVFSIDIEPDLVDLARQRLARLGYQPTLVAADGAEGLPNHAPFDRIIATCAVPTVPWAWVTQTRPGGVILTDLKTTLGAGSLIRLIRHTDRAEGRFDPNLRRLHGVAPPPCESRPHPTPAHEEPVSGTRAPHHHPGPTHSVGFAARVVPGQLRPRCRHLAGLLPLHGRETHHHLDHHRRWLLGRGHPHRR
jgi:protein-L-isoaspartate(D-aspartate) O-methyltransferase